MGKNGGNYIIERDKGKEGRDFKYFQSVKLEGAGDFEFWTRKCWRARFVLFSNERVETSFRNSPNYENVFIKLFLKLVTKHHFSLVFYFL